MEMIILLKANAKQHKRSITCIFIIIFLVSVSLCTVLTVWSNSGQYVQQEMKRLGFGDITAWVSGISHGEELMKEIEGLDSVERVGVQSILISEYQIEEQSSDSEGQLVLYDPEAYPYRIFTDDLTSYLENGAEILPGEIYVPASLSSMFGVNIGEEITFPIARSGVEKTFVVKGYFEDPFMGSTMIGMKSFLICTLDGEEILRRIENAGIDSLARTGFMLHIFRSGGGYPIADLNRQINENTSLREYGEFTYSSNAIAGFMMTLQNVFTGLLLVFVLVMLLAALVVLGHSLENIIEQDGVNMGILKTIGFTQRRLRCLQLLPYAAGILGGMVLAVAVSFPAAKLVCRMMVTTLGILIPSVLPAGLCFSWLAVILLLLLGFIWVRTSRIAGITPVQVIGGHMDKADKKSGMKLPIGGTGLALRLAIRQILTGKKRYTGAFLVAVLLVFSASVIGRIDSWLGPEGEGLMNAFHPADLDIAAQPSGETTVQDVEEIISFYTAVTDSYMLAMPNVSVNGVDYTANVITEPERFHMLEGLTSRNPDEIVLTEFVSADLGAGIGDKVTVAAGKGSREYIITGIYQCANEMGANIGMSREAYGRIGMETENMWCNHYFIEAESMQPVIMQALKDACGGDVYLHENSWPGLYGILSAMKLLEIFMYGIVIIFILIVTVLTGSRILIAEKQDLGIYQAIGFSGKRLRLLFALRLCIISMTGSLLGVILSSVLTDALVAVFMRRFGISNFSSVTLTPGTLMPGISVTILFTVFAWLAAAGMKKSDLTEYIKESS